MEHRAPGQGRDGFLRLLSLEHLFAEQGCARLLSDEALLAAMARFEGALAQASAKAGILPTEHAAGIEAVCRHARFDAQVLALEGRIAGALAIPFVRHLTAQVVVASPEAARHVHFGATSQDVMDTGLVLCLREAAAHIDRLCQPLGDALAGLVRDHARTPMLGRTLLQPALPVPFGFKAAVWLSMLARCRKAFREAAREACVLQFGGAAGTLSAFGARADAVAEALANELGLPRAEITWHSARDGFARLGSEAAMLAGAAAKIARDVTLLMQAEVAEAMEPPAPGRGGSSSMPHKRNPAGSLPALEAAGRAPQLAATLLGQLAPEHERGIGQWQSQWLTLRELLGAVASGVSSMADVMGGLVVDAAAMRRNLEALDGLAYSEAVSVRLSESLGKAAAHALTEKLCAQAVAARRTLLQVMQEDAEVLRAIPASELAALFRPERCYGSADAMMERALRAWGSATSS